MINQIDDMGNVAEPTGEDMVGIIEQLKAEAEQKKVSESLAISRQELQNYCTDWLNAAVNWRKSSWEAKWLKWQRNADSIYDPESSAKKEGWQSKVFIPTTASHRETIQASIFRTIFGARPIMEMRPRHEMGDQDQSENIRDMILREMERTRMEIESNKVLEDCTTFGSGFCRVRFEDRKEKRLVRKPRVEVDPTNMAQVGQSFNGEAPVVAYDEILEDVPVYRGVRMEHLSIWDVFIDPKALEIRGNHAAFRFRATYGDLVAGAQAGYYFADSVEELKDVSEESPKDDSQLSRDAERLISGATSIQRSEYGNKLECYELFARIPKKWAMMGNPIEGDPEELVPSRIIFHKNALLAVEPSREYDGEPPIYHMPYLPVAGQFYGRGIPEMLSQVQEVINETVNQRIDNVSLVINRGFAVIDKAIVSMKELVSKPGWVVRLNGKYVNDVRQAIQEFNFPDVTMSAYRDVLEMERYAQERSSANRVTTGTAGMVKDANQTLGGMEMLRQSANEKFAYIGMIAEFGFLYEIFRAFWKTLYANLQPEDVIKALGTKRAATFELMSPEAIDQDYVFEPQGIYTMENRAMMQAKLGQMHQIYAMYPWYNPMASFDRMAKYNNLDPDSMKYSPQEMQQMMMANAMMQQAQQPVPDPKPGMPAQAGPQRPPNV